MNDKPDPFGAAWSYFNEHYAKVGSIEQERACIAGTCTAYTQAALDASDYGEILRRITVTITNYRDTKPWPNGVLADCAEAIKTLVHQSKTDRTIAEAAEQEREFARRSAEAAEQRAEEADRKIAAMEPTRLLSERDYYQRQAEAADADHDTYEAAIKEWREQLQTAEAERDALREEVGQLKQNRFIDEGGKIYRVNDERAPAEQST